MGARSHKHRANDTANCRTNSWLMLGNFMQQFRGRIQDQIPFINLDALHPQTLRTQIPFTRILSKTRGCPLLANPSPLYIACTPFRTWQTNISEKIWWHQDSMVQTMHPKVLWIKSWIWTNASSRPWRQANDKAGEQLWGPAQPVPVEQWMAESSSVWKLCPTPFLG